MDIIRHIPSTTSIDNNVKDEYSDENLTESLLEGLLIHLGLTNVSTEDTSSEPRVASIYALGVVLASCVVISLCTLLWYRILGCFNRVDYVENPIMRTNLAPPPTPVNQNTSPKRTNAMHYGLPSERIHRPSTSRRLYQLSRDSPESIETFEPLASYKYVHPNIPGACISPRGSSTESENLPLHDRAFDVSLQFADGLGIGTISSESVQSSSSVAESYSSESENLRLHRSTTGIPDSLTRKPLSRYVQRRATIPEDSNTERLDQETLRFFHRNIPAMLIVPQGSSVSESLPSDDGGADSALSFADGLTRRPLASESIPRSLSNPEDMTSRRNSIDKIE